MAARKAMFLARTTFNCCHRICRPQASIEGLRSISCNVLKKGLEEFFPPGVYESGGPGPKEVKTGRRWHVSDLRQKSNEDLHKLWYVLLKEMNMLQTVKAEAKNLQVPMPNPERIMKVKKSMAQIKIVIGERETALKKLEALGYVSEKEQSLSNDGEQIMANNNDTTLNETSEKSEKINDSSENTKISLA